MVLHFTDSQGQLHEKTMSGGYVRTTNNRMELMAAIVGAGSVKPPLRGRTVLRFQVPDGRLQPALDRQLDREELEPGERAGR